MIRRSATPLKKEEDILAPSDHCAKVDGRLLLSLKEVAALTGISTSTLHHRFCVLEEIPVVKLPAPPGAQGTKKTILRFWKADVLRYLQSHTKKGGLS